MKPHRLSDLLDALYKSINPGYGPGRQKEEFVRALEAVGIRPEHGNRGQELETMVLVDAGELRRSHISQLRRMMHLADRKASNYIHASIYHCYEGSPEAKRKEAHADRLHQFSTACRAKIARLKGP